ncbi:MAG: S8 family serine peptidase [Rhodospirillaceae bacterium]|nr:S8 family serine peptidase [Rhodospirillaceae bacterium]
MSAISPARAQLESILQQLEAQGNARVIVRLKDAAQDQAWSKTASVYEQRAVVEQMRRNLESALAVIDLTIDQSFSSLPFVSVKVDREQLGAMLAMGDVAGVYPVTIERKAKLETSSAVEGPSLASSVPSMDVEAAWARGYEGEGLAVAVIDGGIAVNHAMLSGKAVGAACFSATFGGDTFTQCPSGITPEIGFGAASNCPFGSDRCDHGTHVASTAVGNDGANFGVARAAQLMPIDVFSEVTSESVCDPDPSPCELTDSLAVLDALNYVNENVDAYNIVAVNLSIGGGSNTGPCDSDPRKVVIDMLREKGVATTAAAGNQESNNSINAPACISSAVGVGATNDGTGVAPFSNFTPFMDVMAPGVNIRGADPDGGLTTFSGTSMAAPHVAGAYAVIRSAIGTASIDAIDAAINVTGTDVSRAGQNFTLPRIQVHHAILELQGINIKVFNNVIGSRTTDVGESYIRLHNASTEAGQAKVILRDAETGAQLGRWTSPHIPAHASFQFNVSQLESEAEANAVIARDDRTYYNLLVESNFDGSMQHVLWQRTAGVLSNMTSCPDGLSGGERTLLNVHSPSILQYPSAIRVYNDSASTLSSVLDIFNATTGESIGQWTSPLIEAGAAYEASLSEIISDIETADAVTDLVDSLPGHLNVELSSDFNGYLQHTIRNNRSDVLTDMSAKCALGNNG